MRTKLVSLAILSLAFPAFAEQTELKTDFQGDTFKINHNATELGAANWAEPEKTWRTVGELIKSAVPPANAEGRRPDVVLVTGIDEGTPWGALKSLLMAASGLGIPQARVNVPGKPGAHILLPLPGADPTQGETVDFPLFAGPDGALTENGGKKLKVTQALLGGLVKQLPDATVNVKAAPELKALQVVAVLRMLVQEVKPKAFAYLPVKQITPEEAAGRKEAEDSVNRAFEGGLGGLGK
ncbi:MAG: hypothetical protein M5U26_17875 [Planctomycetota bacterium]|nr:hypothetical protein [Planctomycetota bacterium]